MLQKHTEQTRTSIFACPESRVRLVASGEKEWKASRVSGRIAAIPRELSYQLKILIRLSEFCSARQKDGRFVYYEYTRRAFSGVLLWNPLHSAEKIKLESSGNKGAKRRKTETREWLQKCSAHQIKAISLMIYGRPNPRWHLFYSSLSRSLPAHSAPGKSNYASMFVIDLPPLLQVTERG